MLNYREFILFLVTGGIAAVVNLTTRVIFNLVMSFEVAILCAYICGMTTAYVLARLFVFEQSGRSMSDEAVRFGIVNLIAVAQVWVVSVSLNRIVFPWLAFSWHSDTIAHLIGVAVPIATSYLGHKYFTFAQSARAQNAED